MKKFSLSLSELLYIFSFLLYLFASSLTHIENGAELSLWLMAFAVIASTSTTVLPWLGIQYLRLENKGSRSGYRLAVLLQAISWVTFGSAMFHRLGRNLPAFHTRIMVTTLLWAAWMIIFIYSRHACQTDDRDDTLKNKSETTTPPHKTSEEL